MVGASRTVSTTQVQGYETPSAPPRNPPAKTVWIGNLPFFVAKEEVRKKFSPYGPVSSIGLSAVSFFFRFFLFLLLFLLHPSNFSSPSLNRVRILSPLQAQAQTAAQKALDTSNSSPSMTPSQPSNRSWKSPSTSQTMTSASTTVQNMQAPPLTSFTSRALSVRNRG